jgi:hypothetical protein
VTLSSSYWSEQRPGLKTVKETVMIHAVLRKEGEISMRSITALLAVMVLILTVAAEATEPNEGFRDELEGECGWCGECPNFDCVCEVTPFDLEFDERTGEYQLWGTGLYGIVGEEPCGHITAWGGKEVDTVPVVRMQLTNARTFAYHSNH